MDAHIAEWLIQKFNAVTEVKIATKNLERAHIFQNHHADFVVETWMGARLYVYYYGTEPKLRDIRAILKENTRSGIGTLFIVDGELLPEHDTTLKREEWHEVLYGLNERWIYGVMRQADSQLSLAQIHFEPTVYQDTLRCWHVTDFVIESVVVRPRHMETPLKGNWYVGDIASAQYKRRINYERVTQRFHYQTKQTHEVKSKAPADRLAQYYEMLCLPQTASEKEVKRAFRQMALRVHPDVSALPRVEAERRIKELIEAYEIIKAHHGWR